MTTVRNEKGKFQKKTEVENFKKDQPVNPRLAEIMKCSEDALYFIKNYCMIQHPQRGSIKLEPYPYQEDCIKAFQTNSKNIVLKSRQLGLSTITSAFVTKISTVSSLRLVAQKRSSPLKGFSINSHSGNFVAHCSRKK